MTSVHEQKEPEGEPDKRQHLVNIPKMYIKISPSQNLSLIT
jgi:hypothetical protein